MRPSTAICLAVLVGAAVSTARLPADDGTYPPSAPLPRIIGTAPVEPIASGVAEADLPAVMPGIGSASAAAAPVCQAGAACEPRELRHCSVIGAVQFPGTYAGEFPSIMLRTLLEQAGGITADAAGTVRILHAGQQQVLSIAPLIDKVVVPSESVVVVDSSVAGPRSGVGDQVAYTDVACLNLLERPVVLWLDPQQATLSGLLNLLRQRPDVSQTVQVIAPPSTLRASPNALTSGDVLVFDPRSIDQQALADILTRWPLQDLVTIETQDVQQTAAETVELFQFLESRMRPAEEFASLDEVETLTGLPFSEASDARSKAAEPAHRASNASPTAPPALVAPEPVAKTTESAPDSSVFPASAIQLRSVNAPKSLPVDDVEELDAEGTRAMDEAAARHQAADEVVASSATDAGSVWWRFGRSFMAWVLCGLAGYGLFSVWTRQHNRRQKARIAPILEAPLEADEPEPTTPVRSTLRQLIDHSLPIREEEAPAPTQTLHGRSVGFRYLIRSGPHPIQGPHFATTRPHAPTRETAMASAPLAAAQERPANVAAKSSVGTVNRFDAAAVAEPTESTRMTAPSSREVSPLERALRSLMREGRDDAP